MGIDNSPFFSNEAGILESRRNLELDLSKIEPRRFTVIGESHGDVSIIDLVSRLIGTGSFSSLYLEALHQGDYAIQGDRLKHPSDSVYAYAPRKYDQLIALAQERGLRVYGIDHSADRSGRITDEWARYVIDSSSGSSGNNLLLVGEVHAVRYTYGEDPPSRHRGEVLPACLQERGVAREDIFIISDALGRLFYQIKEINNGLYYPYELDKTPLGGIVKVRQPVVDLVRI